MPQAVMRTAGYNGLLQGCSMAIQAITGNGENMQNCASTCFMFRKGWRQACSVEMCCQRANASWGLMCSAI